MDIQQQLSEQQQQVEFLVDMHRQAFDTDLEKYNRQYPAIKKVQLPQKEHDRFLMIDDTVYILGDSLKNLGHSMTTVLRTSFTVEEILGKLRKSRVEYIHKKINDGTLEEWMVRPAHQPRAVSGGGEYEGYGGTLLVQIFPIKVSSVSGKSRTFAAEYVITHYGYGEIN